jgi:hypothetical protein
MLFKFRKQQASQIGYMVYKDPIKNKEVVL